MGKRPVGSADTSEPVRPTTTLRVCLAASGGGHLRQLLDLQSVWSAHDYFFVTEDTALGQSLVADHPVEFVQHFGWGQARLGAPFRMAAGAFRNLFQSLGVVLRRRPQVVISTGAGAVFFTVLLSRLLGARVIIVESFARFEHASLFGRMAAPFAHHLVVQSEQLSRHYPKAAFFDPLKVLDKPAPPKKPLLFATVGAILPFDRLVSAVASLKAAGEIQEDVLVQTGVGGLKPDTVEVVETLPFAEVQALLRDASIVVCHGGTGSIITALREGCHVIAVPRLQALGEVYDDHQAEITEAFVKRGFVQAANNAEELKVALAATASRERVLATTEPMKLAAYLNSILDPMSQRAGLPKVARSQ